MARIAGVDLPQNKQIEIGLTHIYGIGRRRAINILEAAAVPGDTKVKDLTEDQARQIRQVVENEGRVEGDLRKIVGQHIKRLIDQEDAVRPLSDQQLVRLLKERDIDIARRTVAKYREMLRIPSSSKRKQVF